MINATLCNGRVELVDIFHDKHIANFIVHLHKDVPKEILKQVGDEHISFTMSYLINEGFINASKPSVWKTNYTIITQ
jgi:hypothetical protein